jgi:hypothetical protein
MLTLFYSVFSLVGLLASVFGSKYLAVIGSKPFIYGGLLGLVN